MVSSRPGITPLLETKFHVPRRRAGSVTRRRLVERLRRAADARLTLISAPPGFGKTTLLAEWLATAGPGAVVAWVSLETTDDESSRFWTYVFTAIGRRRPEVQRSGVVELLEGPQHPPIETVLTILLNAVAMEPAELTLILDDYHVIESEAIHRGLSYLLDHLPPQLRVVVATRVDPPLALARLRARGELAEIRASDLRFTLDEAEEYLNGELDLGLGSTSIAALERRTEGWAGALQLAGLSLRGREGAEKFIAAFSGDNRFVVDYLVEEVLDRQPAVLRGFLLQTSILEQLSAPLCDAITGRDDGRAMLDSAERGNLFVVPLDDQRRWYRYHQLFSEALQAHLREESPDLEADLHRRASRWYAANGETDRAVGHAIRGKDFAGAAGIIEVEAQGILRRHHPDQLIGWLKHVPESVIASMPVLSTFYGHALQGSGDMERSAEWLRTAEQFMDERPEDAIVFDHASFALLPALIALGQGYLAMTSHDPEAAADRADAALAVLPGDQHHWRGTALGLLGLAHWIRGDLGPAEAFQSEAASCFERTGDTGLAIISGYHHAELLKARGQLNQAERRLRSSLRFVAGRGAESRGAANLHLGLSELLCERNDLEGAAREIARAEELGVYPPRVPFRLCLAQAKLAQSRGELEAAVGWLDEAERLQIRGAVPDYRPVAAWRARLHAAQGHTAKAFEWVRARGISARDEPGYDLEYEQITLARLLLARRQDDDIRAAAQLLEVLLGAARAAGRLGTAWEISVVLGVARWADGDKPGALEAFGAALIGAEPEGYCRLFLDEHESILPLLRAAAEQGTAAEYCGRLQQALEGRGSPLPATSGPDALSDRESEVLRLLATELSGPDIARELVVSLHTLRSHTKSIYSKLDVNSRRAAVRRAAELGLV